MIYRSNKILFLFCVVLFCSCQKKIPQSVSNTSNSDLAGQKWRIYQYKDATTNTPQPRTDTLIFTDATNYKFNNQSFTYYLTITNSNSTHLSLYGTPFGDLDGTVPNNFIQNAEIINVPFSQLKAGGALTYFIWMKKIN